MIPPGKTIGMLGGGQLGRMTGQAARELGYGFAVYEPAANCPAGHVADAEINAPYSDQDALRRFAEIVDVISYEFENVAVEALQELEKRAPLFPTPNALHICQHREREKRFLESKGFPIAPFAVIDSPETLRLGIERIGIPCVLKTASFGYDGKGQIKISEPVDDYDSLWRRFGADRAVLEAWIAFDKEISVIAARGADDQIAIFPISENIHTNHILDLSIVPARISDAMQQEARRLGTALARELDIVGLLAVELFVLKDGSLAVNEMAPRPHNSGHFTMDACATSQFEQFVRAISGMPLGSPALLKPVVMLNILGDSWEKGEPAFDEILSNPNAKLHLYGKSEARPGRKMGHINLLADSCEEALTAAKQLKATLSPTPLIADQ